LRNYFRNNVTAAIATNPDTGNGGFGYWTPFNSATNPGNFNPMVFADENGNIRYPKYRGSCMEEVGVDHDLVSFSDYAMLEFLGNEAYACRQGFSADHRIAGQLDYLGYQIKNFSAWGCSQATSIYACDSGITIDGLVTRGCTAFRNANEPPCRILNADIQIAQGDWPGIDYSGGADRYMRLEVADCYFRCAVGILLEFASDGGDFEEPYVHDAYIDGCKFQAPAGSQSYKSIVAEYRVAWAPCLPHRTYVTRYQGVANNNFRVRYTQQKANVIVPYAADLIAEGAEPTRVARWACPEKGLTNAQCWTKYKRAIGGEVAPSGASATARPEIVGLTSPT
jgi:hypothetical protein